MGWALVALLLSVLLVAFSFMASALLGQGYGAFGIFMPADAISERLLHHSLTFPNAVVVTIFLYWSMILCVCIAAADRSRLKQAMSVRRAVWSVAAGASVSFVLYVLNRGGAIEMIPNLPGMLVLASVGMTVSVRLPLLLFLANTVCYSFAAFLILNRLIWRRSA